MIQMLCIFIEMKRGYDPPKLRKTESTLSEITAAYTTLPQKRIVVGSNMPGFKSPF